MELSSGYRLPFGIWSGEGFPSISLRKCFIIYVIEKQQRCGSHLSLPGLSLVIVYERRRMCMYNKPDIRLVNSHPQTSCYHVFPPICEQSIFNLFSEATSSPAYNRTDDTSRTPASGVHLSVDSGSCIDDPCPGNLSKFLPGQSSFSSSDLTVNNPQMKIRPTSFPNRYGVTTHLPDNILLNSFRCGSSRSKPETRQEANFTRLIILRNAGRKSVPTWNTWASR